VSWPRPAWWRQTNEIGRFRSLLDGLDLAGRVVTADALHPQREHPDWLVTVKHAAYLLIVKANQRSLHHQLATLPRRAIPIADHTRDRGHGRTELRRLQSPPSLAWLPSRRPGDPHHPPGPAACRPVMAGRDGVRGHQPHRRPGPPRPLANCRHGHWGIEALHHLRDTTFAEDASQVRTGNTPRAMASQRNPWPSASCASTAGTASPQRCAATPATAPESCPCSASPAHDQPLRHSAEALGQASPINQGKKLRSRAEGGVDRFGRNLQAEFRGFCGVLRCPACPLAPEGAEFRGNGHRN
jgi:predicted transposase YbfD/YdcC